MVAIPSVLSDGVGVRLYDPKLGRFLEVDPVEGGSANDYDYVNGDPVNEYDLGGTCNGWGCLALPVMQVKKKVADPVVAVGKGLVKGGKELLNMKTPVAVGHLAGGAVNVAQGAGRIAAGGTMIAAGGAAALVPGLEIPGGAMMLTGAGVAATGVHKVIQGGTQIYAGAQPCRSMCTVGGQFRQFGTDVSPWPLNRML